MYSDIFIFNPTCEMAIANGTVSYMPPRILQQFEKDLQVIPSYFACEDDFVIVKESVDKSWISYMKELGFKLPKYILRDEINRNKLLLNSDLGFVRPWGWSPVVHNFFKNTKVECSDDFKNTPNFNWDEAYKNIYSRITSLNLYKYITGNYCYDFLSDIDDAPVVCFSIDDVQEQLDKYNSIVVKAPWSSSGRGLLVIKGGTLSKLEYQWISGILKNQTYIMAEEWREKVFDISFHYFIDNKFKVNHIGNASFFTDEKGAYIGNNLKAVPIALNKDIRNFLSAEKMDALSNIIKKALSKSIIPENYYGYLGVDAYVYKTNGTFKIFPCVEINLRYNMGTLNLKLREFVNSDSEGYIITQRVNDISVHEFKEKMQKDHPLEFRHGKMSKGFLSLVPVNNDSIFINYLLLE